MVFDGCSWSFLVNIAVGGTDESRMLGAEFDRYIVTIGSIFWIGWECFFGCRWWIKWSMIFFREEWEVVAAISIGEFDGDEGLFECNE
jgi:hypothetical protein